MGVDGVRAVNYVTLTQGPDYNNGNDIVFSNPLFDTTISGNGASGGLGTSGYGYQYDFNDFYNPCADFRMYQYNQVQDGNARRDLSSPSLRWWHQKECDVHDFHLAGQ